MHIPQPGDIYRFTIPTDTLAGVSYDIGDRLELIEQTEQDPYGRKGKLCNWIVKCKHFTPPAEETTWSMIWYLIEHELIAYVEPNDA